MGFWGLGVNAQDGVVGRLINANRYYYTRQRIVTSQQLAGTSLTKRQEEDQQNHKQDHARRGTQDIHRRPHEGQLDAAQTRLRFFDEASPHPTKTGHLHRPAEIQFTVLESLFR